MGRLITFCIHPAHGALCSSRFWGNVDARGIPNEARAGIWGMRNRTLWVGLAAAGVSFFAANTARAQALPSYGDTVAAPAAALTSTGNTPGASANPQLPTAVPSTQMPALSRVVTIPPMSPAVQGLLDFRDADVKFDVTRLMDILRDKRHEGWVLAAYPDPKTAQPLIGAGFSLDLPAREHPQRDPLNAHPFLEPSSSDLWQAAGLPAEKLSGILTDFYAHLDADGKTGFRREIRDLQPQITPDDANALLRIGIVQAIYNAKAYCRNFDHLSASQQMAMTQLVYQMGVNLEEFRTFLNLMNRDGMAESAAMARADRAYWRSVQLSLVQSQWARLYRDRARAVIAMLDPRYEVSPTGAEHSIGGVMRPVRTRRGHHGATLRRASYTRHRGSASRRQSARSRRN